MSKAISGEFSGTKGEGAALVSQLQASGEKINKTDVVAITQDASGKTVWLEKGHLGERPSGLAHIVDCQGRGQGRPIYEFTYEGTTRRIAITIGSNGYVVGANPKSVPKEAK